MYQKTQHIHFTGIGGIGMSGIASILAKQGYQISGCDSDVTQKSVQKLRSYGCMVHEGNNAPECSDHSINIVVYSSAIKKDNAEIEHAQKRGIPTIPRALMLAELMRTKYSLAIAGAHGKTTTTAMVAHILITAQYDPTIVAGGFLNAISDNAHYGTGKFLVAEADESDRSLTLLHPALALVTNIDLEHLETYKDLDDIKDTFLQFLTNIPFYGAAIMCIDDPHIRSILPLPIPNVRVITYGIETDAHIYGTNLSIQADHTNLTVCTKNKISLGNVRVNMPGRHNALNALGAIAMALEVDVPFATIAEALSTFSGVERRFSFHGTYRDAAVFDDYGHHPNEIVNALLVARKRAEKNLTVVFQPHRFIRTERLWNQFIEVFLQSTLDHLIITDIYGAGEAPIEGISGKRLAEELQGLHPAFSVNYAPYEDNHFSIKKEIDVHTQSHDLILLLGAGKINKVAQTLLS
jgi:UDP-N-acetylmuramate--alanine ligase